MTNTVKGARKTVCLVTGGPGTGKTTIIKKALGACQGKAGGFYTEEIRERGERTGFRLVTLDGESVVLSSIGIRSPCRVGRYGVGVAALERVGVVAIRRALQERPLVVIDEIGKMELFSPAFREVVVQAVSGPKPVLATVILAHHPFADDIKTLPQCLLLEVTRANREQMAGQVMEWLAREVRG